MPSPPTDHLSQPPSDPQHVTVSVMYRHMYGHNHGHHHVHVHHDCHNWHLDCSFCRHRIHHAYTQESAAFKAQWTRVPASFLCGATGYSATGYSATGYGATGYGATVHGATVHGATGYGATVHGATVHGATGYGGVSCGAHRKHDHRPRTSRCQSKGTLNKASSTRRLGRRSRSQSESKMTAAVRRKRTATDAHTKTDASISAFACGSALRNMCTATPSRDRQPGTSTPRAKTSDQPSSPSPSHSLYTTAFRQTPLFVKHEAIQTTSIKARSRSAFAVIQARADGEATSTTRTPPKDDVHKTPPPPPPPPPPQKTAPPPGHDDETSHHHRHHHHGVCWYHEDGHRTQCRNHSWPHPFHQSSCAHQDKSEHDDSKWAGLFINISKDDWGALFKEAWSRITNMIRRSRGTILLERNPPAAGAAGAAEAAGVAGAGAAEGAGAPSVSGGESGEHADTVCYNAHCRDEQYCSCTYSQSMREGPPSSHGQSDPHKPCFHNHFCCQHQKVEDNNYFYSEKEQPQLHNCFQESPPEQFYDCFECQVCSSHTV